MHPNHTTNNIPYGYCHCGCGQKTSLARENRARDGYVRGEPIRFIRGHSNSRPLAERFWAKVDKRGTHECWEWQGHTVNMGYGQIWHEGKNQYTHRVSHLLNIGPIPEGMAVCHTCDNPKCCNPTHLWLGTYADNAQDMTHKGRHSPQHGSNNNGAKLTEVDVREIRRLFANGVSIAKIGKRYAVSPSTISMAVRRITWKHVE